MAEKFMLGNDLIDIILPIEFLAILARFLVFKEAFYSSYGIAFNNYLSIPSLASFANYTILREPG